MNPKQATSIQSFQNGKFALLEIRSRVKQFSPQDRSKKCLFLSATVHELKRLCDIRLIKNINEFLYFCFGLGSAPRIFSKLLKVPMALLRRLNIRLVIYLEDILPMERSLERILMSRDTFSASTSEFYHKPKKLSSGTVPPNRIFRPK